MSLYEDLNEVLTPYANKINNLNTSLEALDAGENKSVTWVEGYYVKNANPVNYGTLLTDATMRCCVMDASEGDKFYLNIKGKTTAQTYYFTDDAGTILAYSSSSNLEQYGTTITAPAGTTKLILNDVTTDGHYALIISPIVERIEGMENDIDELQENPLFEIVSSYNLIDGYSDIVWYMDDGSQPTVYNCNTYFAVGEGDVIGSVKRMLTLSVYDSEKNLIRTLVHPGNDQFYRFTISDANAAYAKVQFRAYEVTGLDTDLARGEIACVYKIETTAPYSDRREAVPQKQINGRYVTNDIYDVSIPDISSQAYRIINMRQIKRENAEKGALRVGSFNIAGPQGSGKKWHILKRELEDYGLNICGFQEVGGQDGYDWSEMMVGEQFPYDDTLTDRSGGKALLSDCVVESGEQVTIYFNGTNGQASNLTYLHCMVDLPNYRHSRGWNKQLSIYVFHLNSSAVFGRPGASEMANIISADTTEYKMIIADTNCFSRGTDNRPWVWSIFEDAGLYPSLTDFSKSTYLNPISQEDYDGGELDMIDNVFITNNMKCINWNIIDSLLYPAPTSSLYISDHCMIYADIIFDFVEGFEDA